MGEIADDIWNAAFDSEDARQETRRAVERRCRACPPGMKHEPDIDEDDDIIFCRICGASADALG